jgi:hypothetical protein
MSATPVFLQLCSLPLRHIFWGDIAVVHGDVVLSSTNSINDMNKGGVATTYEGNVFALSTALDKVQKNLALEEERRRIAED